MNVLDIAKKQKVGVAPILEFWEMWNTPSVTLLPGHLWLKVVVVIRLILMDQMEIFKHFLYLKPLNNWLLNWFHIT